MTEEETKQAAAYIKLHEDVAQLIRDVVIKELMIPTSQLAIQTKAAVVYCYDLEQKIKQVVGTQMTKF
jgi:hypothetical protein